ncbi:hypothetical protein PR202_ga30207 [Eleusine coracana subsp. coracana]|uniref:Glabrous enhancer-binding protein-like DBD domain-containing protein n=1 Tax=Eleusine coracana subsp. coracana TaxID=191504 RepID=A0AAV5DPB3_ELECO|nr:hypothetical protein PR202_ga30207 [Eleusine coracana subsp. coracana]
MAPKGSAPPAAAVESSESEETGSSSEEESEEEIAHSPPKNTAPPSDREESESDDEEKEDEEETDDEEEEEGKNDNEAEKQEEPASKRDEEETDDEEEEEGEDDDEAEQQEEPAPMQDEEMKDEEETDDEEEEEGEDDDEAEQQEEPAPKQDEAEARSGKLPSSKDKKPAARIQQSWSNDDEVRILEAVAEHRRKHGKMPQSTELEAALAGKLDNSDYGGKELMTKLHGLKALYKRAVQRGKLPSKDLGAQIFDLSKEIWGSSGIPANATVLRDINELCEVYSYFAEEVKAAESSNPGLFKRGFIEDDKAHVLNDKIKKQRLRQAKLELRILDATKEVTKVIMSLM